MKSGIGQVSQDAPGTARQQELNWKQAGACQHHLTGGRNLKYGGDTPLVRPAAVGASPQQKAAFPNAPLILRQPKSSAVCME